MNLCTAYPVFILFCIIGGVAIAYFRGVSIFQGVAIGVAVGFVPLLLLGISYTLLMVWRPGHPRCRCGKCRSEEYEYIGPDHFTPGTIYEYKCPFCRRVYRQKGKHFWELLDDGSEVAYMKISKWGRWQIENT